MFKKYFALVIATLILLTPFFSKAQTVSKHGRVCGATKTGGLASCHIQVLLDNNNNPLVSGSPSGYGPAQLRGAYGVSGRAVGQPIIAIVDAYDDPTIKNDLDAYSLQFHLPVLPLCKAAAAKSPIPCLQKIGQTGGKAMPAANGDWSMEIALDVEAAHAMCENCSLVLIEAKSPNMTNLFAAVDTAVKTGAIAISSSWGGPEYKGETKLDKHFEHNGIAFTVSSGDSGYGVQYPAASPYVTAVGGTSLYMNGNNYSNENAWSGAGSGCSQFEVKPNWQKDVLCKGRTVADVSAVADPSTGAAIYSSTSPKGQKGWFTAGGTSLAAPIIAAVYALASTPKTQTANSLPYLFGNKNNLHDVVGGSNGICSPSYLCTGKTKYDGPTGLGSPNGLGAF
jgi:subtilase family serine protease